MPDRRSASLLALLEARLCSESLGRNWEEVAGILARSHCLLLEEDIASAVEEEAEEAAHIAFGLGCRLLHYSNCLRLHHGLPSWDGERNTRFRKAGRRVDVSF